MERERKRGDVGGEISSIVSNESPFITCAMAMNCWYCFCLRSVGPSAVVMMLLLLRMLMWVLLYFPRLEGGAEDAADDDDDDGAAFLRRVGMGVPRDVWSSSRSDSALSLFSRRQTTTSWAPASRLPRSSSSSFSLCGRLFPPPPPPWWISSASTRSSFFLWL